jgi:hypothetical protein
MVVDHDARDAIELHAQTEVTPNQNHPLLQSQERNHNKGEPYIRQALHPGGCLLKLRSFAIANFIQKGHQTL